MNQVKDAEKPYDTLVRQFVEQWASTARRKSCIQKSCIQKYYKMGFLGILNGCPIYAVTY